MNASSEMMDATVDATQDLCHTYGPNLQIDNVVLSIVMFLMQKDSMQTR